MERSDVKRYFAERISATRLHAFGIGTYEISSSITSIVYHPHDYYQRSDARLLGDMLIEFADRPNDATREEAA